MPVLHRLYSCLSREKLMVHTELRMYSEQFLSINNVINL